MKKNLIRCIALGLAIGMMVLSFAGCGANANAGSESGVNANAETSSAAEESKAAESEVTESADAEVADSSKITWQISDEAKALKEEMMKDQIKDFDAETYYYKMVGLYLTRAEQEIPNSNVKNNLNKEVFGNTNVYTLDNGDDYENIVLYIHGGAWTYEIDKSHVEFCDELVERLNAKVYMPLYPLAPEASYYETYEMVGEFYMSLLEQGKPIYVMGDSAGGNISLGLMSLIKSEGMEMPERLVLLAPCADMTFTNEDMNDIEPNDPILNIELCAFSAKMWANGKDLTDPIMSAVYADTTGYPATLLFAGTCDILYPDNIILYENMKEAGVDITLIEGEGLWHVFPVDDIPEKEMALDKIEEFCKGTK